MLLQRRTTNHTRASSPPRRSSFVGVTVCAALVTLVTGAPSEARAEPAPTPHDLRSNLAIDSVLTISLGTLWLGSELLKATLAPEKCRWCDGDSGSNLNGLDAGARSSFRWKDPYYADLSSSVLAFAVIPLLSLGGLVAIDPGSIRGSRNRVDVLIASEATLVSVGLTQTVKLIAGRQRPYAHGRLQPTTNDVQSNRDENLSFWSGHTSLSFSVATAAGTVASLRGYRGAPIIWATGVPLAAVVGYLRIAADKHHATDVLAGAIFGSVIGVGFPLVFHSRVHTSHASGTSTTGALRADGASGGAGAMGVHAGMGPGPIAGSTPMVFSMGSAW